MKLELELDIPSELVDAEFEAHLKEDVVLRLFADRKIASGRAADLLGVSRMELLQLLRERGIPAVQYTAADWDEDGRTIGVAAGDPLNSLRD